MFELKKILPPGIYSVKLHLWWTTFLGNLGLPVNENRQMDKLKMLGSAVLVCVVCCKI